MTVTDPGRQAERFDRVYRADATTYGARPSVELMHYVGQCLPRGGRALDLAAGLGRDALALAERGFKVTAVDLSEEGLRRCAAEARRRGCADRLACVAGDLCRLDYPPTAFDVIAATTAFDHVDRGDFHAILPRITAALTRRGVLYAEVHTTDDPGSPTGFGRTLDEPVSPTAWAVAHYFAPNELLTALAAHLRIVHYEERREWDESHGRPHAHGKAAALAVPRGAHSPYRGDGALG